MNNVWIIAKKEFVDFFKDKKTFMTTLVLGIVLFPLVMYLSLSNSMNSVNGDINKDQRFPIGVSEKNAYTEALNQTGSYEINVYSTIDEAKLDKMTVFIEFPELLDVTQSGYIQIHYDFNEQSLSARSEQITQVFESVNNQKIGDYVTEHGLSRTILNNIQIKSISTTNQTPEGAFSVYMLSLLLPMLILLQSSQGITALAVDLGAGEKERGTLEPLLTTNASILSIIAGKFIVIATVGVVVAVSSLIATLLAVQVAMSSAIDISIGLTPTSYLVLFILTVCMVFFNSMVALTLSILAKSTKEANTYIVPLAIVPIIVSFMVTFITQSGSSIIGYAIPYVNVALLVVDVIKGQLVMTHLLVGIGSLVVFIGLATIMTVQTFKKESIILRS